MSIIMSPWMNEELNLLADHVGRFAMKELVPHAERWERDRQIDRDSWRKAASAGLLLASIPEAFGGGGGTIAHEATVLQELSRAGLNAFSTGLAVSSGIVSRYILAYGTEEQKRRWLPAMARADLIGAIAMSEPGAGSDLQAVRSTATAVEGGYRINGQKTFVSNGQNADLILVVCRTGPGTGNAALSILGLETAGAEGFGRGRNLEKLGLHAQDTSELFFDDVFVPSSSLLGGVPGEGFKQLVHQLAWERMWIALDATVAMERAVELTVDYVRKRMVFGKPLMEQQNTQFVLADAKTQATVARAFVDSLMVMLAAGELDATTAAMAKLWTTEAAFKLIDACQQLFGGYGYMVEYPIARLFTDARVARVYGGANEIMKLIVARSL